MKLSLKLVGDTKPTVFTIPDDSDLVELEFQIKQGLTLKFDVGDDKTVNVMGSQVQAWSVDS